MRRVSKKTLYILIGIFAVAAIVFNYMGQQRKHSASNQTSTKQVSSTKSSSSSSSK